MSIILFSILPGVCRNPPTMDLRADLAASTRSAHEALERLMALDREHTPGRYPWYLLTMHAVVGAVERQTACDERLARLGLTAGRRKLPWLEADLRDLGLAAHELACVPAIPANVPGRVGWLYVLEGSTLGGRVMLKDAAPRLGVTSGRGAAFLAGYGDRTAEMWRTFVAALNAIAFDAAQKAACAAAAAQAFEAIGEVFRAVSVARADARLDGQLRGGLAA